MSNERSDEEVLQAIAAQEIDALEIAYTRYGGAALSLALRITGNRETAEEVVQEAFLSIWRRAATYRPDRGSARAWLLGVVHHRAIDVVRARNARGVTVELDDDAPLASKDDLWQTVEQRLDRAAIREAMAALPEEQRQSIELAYFGGFSYPEIARALGVPLGTIKSRLRLGLEKLHTSMAESRTVEPPMGPGSASPPAGLAG